MSFVSDLVKWVRSRNRTDRHSRRRPVRAGIAQDPLGQDHAADSCARSPRARYRRRRSAISAPLPTPPWYMSLWRTG